MLTKKLLLGGTAAVGSVATAAVVTSQYGLPSNAVSNVTEITEPQKEIKRPKMQTQSNPEQQDTV